VDVDELVAQVGTKAPDKPRPVCFCFAHTTKAIEDDLDANRGASTIMPAIKAAVNNGLCACEHLSPTGRCCLASVHATIRAHRSRIG
jgi:hypothetical protein